jgi:hypothetical protein
MEHWQDEPTAALRLCAALQQALDAVHAHESLTVADVIAGCGEFVASGFATLAVAEDLGHEETMDFLVTFGQTLVERTFEVISAQRDQEPPIP